MKSLVLFAYSVLPKKWVRAIGKSKAIKPIRDFLLRSNDGYVMSTVQVTHKYLEWRVLFKFTAPIRVAYIAKRKGHENKLLRHSMQLLKKYKSHKECTVLDVGANFGYLSLVWAKTVVGLKGRVFSFEPSPSVHAVLRQNALDNKLEGKMIVKNLAVGSEPGKLTMYDSGTTSNVSKTEKKKKAFDVEMVSIDSFCKRESLLKVDLIKIDVDGIELEILKGAKVTIKEMKPILIVETNNDSRIVDFCASIDFKLYDMEMKELKFQDKLPLNLICVPKSLLQ